MRRILLLLTMVLLSMQVRAGGGTILVLGDSLSAAYGIPVEKGWVALLAGRLRAQGYPHRVVNASVSGETTRGGLSRLGYALATHRPQIVIVELGANDGLLGQPLEEMEVTLTRIIDAARAGGAAVLLARMRLPPNYGPAYVKRFEAVYDRVAGATGAVLAPFIMDGVAGHPDLLQDDGLHPTAEAQPRMLDNVWPALEPMLK